MISRIVTVPWNALLNTTFFGLAHSEGGACIKNQYVNIYSIGLNRTDVRTWESYFQQLIDFYQRYPTYDGRFLVQRYPTQGVLAIPDFTTAYPYREAKIQM
jgi:fumiquinazoline A oxidase